MEDLKLSACDMLLIMPPGILGNVHDLFESCHASATINPKAVEASQELLDAMYDHRCNQQRFYAARKELKESVAEAKSFDAEKAGLADALDFTLNSRTKYHDSVKFLLSVLGELQADTAALNSVLKKLQCFDNLPSTSYVVWYIGRQRAVYAAFKKLFEKIKRKLNSRRNKPYPGEEYGLRPFEDIMYGTDGQILMWNDIIEDWDLPEDIHPCREMPGSNWGKFFYEMTPGEFYSKEKRLKVEWLHPPPLKKLIESMQTTHFLANSATPGPEYNMKLAAATGLPYPLYDTDNLERTPYHSDLSALVNEPFIPPPEDISCPHELSSKVEELATGAAPVVQDVQEMEAFVYRLPQ
ncbi:hypothetical protein Sste5346_004682 [Sporothrix stenoceras]|uniref:Uncharacterized protein n=1 Tax=Sporothrix stenoceras TaxID=5173 RepID=A0ABR3Z9V1_9PEZI